MTRDEMLEQVRAAHRAVTGYCYDERLAAVAIDAGLEDGDKIDLGGNLVAHIRGPEVAMIHKDAESARVALAAMTQQQRDRLLVLKAARASRMGTATGRL